MNAAQSNAAHAIDIDHAAADAATAAQHRAAEPSMEEILASIRRIIADDDALPLAPRPAPRLVAEPSPLVLAVVNPPAAVSTLAPAAAYLDPFAAPDFDSPVYEAQAPAESTDAEPVALHSGEEPALLVSSDTSVAVHASFEQLAATIMAQNAAMVEESIRGMLRPMLKSWLDDNLPVIVEKLVRGEIERVARGGR